MDVTGTVLASANIGIGSSAPAEVLDVTGYILGGASNDYLALIARRDIAATSGTVGFLLQTNLGGAYKDRMRVARDTV